MEKIRDEEMTTIEKIKEIQRDAKKRFGILFKELQSEIEEKVGEDANVRLEVNCISETFEDMSTINHYV